MLGPAPAQEHPPNPCPWLRYALGRKKAPALAGLGSVKFQIGNRSMTRTHCSRCNPQAASAIKLRGAADYRMPLTHRVLKEQRLVLIVGSGDVAANDIVANRQALLSDPDFDPSFNALVDFTHVPETSLDLDAMRTLSREPLFSRASRIAIVPVASGSEALFAIARMYETYREVSNMGDHLRVFRTLEKAREWLRGSSIPRAA